MIKELLIVILVIPMQCHCQKNKKIKEVRDYESCLNSTIGTGKKVADDCICLARKGLKKPYSRRKCPGSNCKSIGIEFENVKLIEIDLKQQIFTSGFSFLVKWEDSRIFRSDECLGTILLTEDMEQFWMPKLNIDNLIDVQSKSVLGNVNDLELKKHELHYRSTVKLEIACKMNFADFPFDSQACSIEVNYSYYDHFQQKYVQGVFHYLRAYNSENIHF